MGDAARIWQISKPKLILGEGKEEVGFFKALMCHLGIGDVDVRDYGGKTKLGAFLGALLRQPEFEMIASLAITIDADHDAVASFDAVDRALRACSLPIPSGHGKATKCAGGRPQISAFVLPDGKNPGKLEDLCLASVADYPEMECLDEYFSCVSDKATREPEDVAKARVHAWLATQINPELRLGEAAQKGYWPWNARTFEELRGFMRSL